MPQSYKTIDSIKPPTYVKPQTQVGTLKPQGHLWHWERTHEFNRFERMANYVEPQSWETFLENIFAWYHRERTPSPLSR